MDSSLFRRILLPVFFLLLTVAANAQQPPIPSTGFAGLDQYRASRLAVFTDDFGQLKRYRGANGRLRRRPARPP